MGRKDCRKCRLCEASKALHDLAAQPSRPSNTLIRPPGSKVLVNVIQHAVI